MSNHLDARVRALVAEIVESAPEPHPFPPAGIALRQRPGPVHRGQRLALATLILVIIVGSALGITNLLSVGGGDGEASATTPAPAATSRPTTTVSASDTTTATTAAPDASSDAAETTSAPTVPPDPRAAAVAALDIQCPSFIQTLTPLFDGVPATPQTYASALSSLDGELFGIRTAVSILGSGSEYDLVVAQLDAVERQVAAAGGAGVVESVASISAIEAALRELSSALATFGVSACNALPGIFP